MPDAQKQYKDACPLNDISQCPHYDPPREAMTAKILQFPKPQIRPGSDNYFAQRVDFAQAEALITAFRATYPELRAWMERLYTAQQRLDDAIGLATLSFKELSMKLPREDKSVRVSAKTGHSWPKPKGGY